MILWIGLGWLSFLFTLTHTFPNLCTSNNLESCPTHMNDPTVIFAVLILSSNWFCCSPMRNSVFWVATKILVLFFHPQLDCLICVPQRYSSGVSLRFRQNLYTEFRTSHLWLSPFLDSPSLHLPATATSLIYGLSLFRPEGMIPLGRMGYAACAGQRSTSAQN